jgi:aryl-alcohol dehydrogenase-like predicted oxidoreductase
MIKQRALGPFTVSAIGMGCMPLSFPHDRTPDLINQPDLAISVIHAALDAGITLLDTADIYAPSWNTVGHNELLVGKALASWSGTAAQKSKVVITTKGGITREKDGTMFGISGRNASKHYLYRAVEASAYKLGLAKIPLWQHHRTDPSISYEEQFDNVMTLKEHGCVAEIGVSNVNAQMLRHAIKVGGTPKQGGIISVQNEFRYLQRIRNRFSSLVTFRWRKQFQENSFRRNWQIQRDGRCQRCFSLCANYCLASSSISNLNSNSRSIKSIFYFRFTYWLRYYAF